MASEWDKAEPLNPRARSTPHYNPLLLPGLSTITLGAGPWLVQALGLAPRLGVNADFEDLGESLPEAKF